MNRSKIIDEGACNPAFCRSGSRAHFAEVGIAIVAIIAMLAGLLSFVFARSLVHLILPLAMRLDSDGVINTSNQLLLLKIIRQLALLLVGGGGGILLWLHTAKKLAGCAMKEHAEEACNLTPSINPSDWASVAGASVILATLAIPILSNGLDYDEIVTAQSFVLTPSWKDVFCHIMAFNNHVAYSALARICTNMLGSAEWSLRLPAMVMGIAALFPSYFTAMHLFDRVTARLSVLLLAVSPVMVTISASARGYTGLVLFSSLSTLIFLKILDKPTKRRFVLYTIFTAFAVWFHLYGLLCLLAHAIYMFLSAHRKRHPFNADTFLSMLYTFLGTGILALSIYIPTFYKLWMVILRRGDGVFQPMFVFSITSFLSGDLILFSALVFVGFFFLFRDKHSRRILLSTLFCTTILIPWMMRPFDLYTRFFVFLLPLWLCIGAYPLALLLREKPKSRYISLSLVMVVLLVWGWNSRTGIEAEGYRAAGSAMLEDSDSATVFLASGGGHLVSYYTHRPVTSPATWDDFVKMIGPATDIRFAYRQNKAGKSIHPETVIKFLRENAEASECGNTTVFRWTRPKNLDIKSANPDPPNDSSER